MKRETLEKLILFVQETRQLLNALTSENAIQIDYGAIALSDAANELIITLKQELHDK